MHQYPGLGPRIRGKETHESLLYQSLKLVHILTVVLALTLTPAVPHRRRLRVSFPLTFAHLDV
jgi:hypothetical protein